MPTEIKLKLAKDREYVQPNSRQVLVIVGLEVTQAGVARAPVERFGGVELVLAVDCSGSMSDPELSAAGGPNKLDQAIQAVWSTLAQVSPNDTISVVGFDEAARVVLDPISGRECAQFRDPSSHAPIERRLRSFGGRTNVIEAFKVSRNLLRRQKGTIQRIILLSDGMANEPNVGTEQAILSATLQQAEQLAAEGVVVDVLGYGRGADLYFDFLSALARPSGGERERVAAAPDDVLKRILSGAQGAYASHVELALTFPSQVQVGDIYRFEPQIMYLGPGPVTAKDRTIRVRAGQLEMGKAYTWIFETIAPPARINPIMLAQVSLTYQLPDGSLRQDQGTLSVQMTTNVEQASMRDGHYMLFYEQAKLNKLEHALTEAQKERNVAKMTQLLTQMMQKCRELGLYEDAARFQKTLDSFAKDGDFVRAALAAAGSSTQSKIRPSQHIREGGTAMPPPPKPHRADRSRRRPAAGKQAEPDTSIYFTAFHPGQVLSERWYKLLVYVHLLSAFKLVLADKRSQLGAQAGDFLASRDRSARPIKQGAEIVIVPELPGHRFNPPRASLLWLEAWHRAEFQMQADPDLPGFELDRPVTGRVAFYVGPILVGEVRISGCISNDAGNIDPESPDSQATANPYQSIFVSYSHQDAAIVDGLEKAYTVLGMKYLRDVRDLRSGQKWNRALLDMIEEADVFQLCWSNNAKTSRYVKQEWQHALSLGRHSFIRPVYWEQPMPKPPRKLKNIHFAYYEKGG